MAGASQTSTDRQSSLLVGDRAVFRRVLGDAPVAPSLGTVLYILRVDTVYPSFVLVAWSLMVVAAVLLAGYAGWRGGGLTAG